MDDLKELHKVTDRIFYYPHEEERDRPVLGYIKGRNGSVAIDAGASPRHAAEFYEALGANDLPLPDYTLITHWHWDHTFGLHACSGKSFAHVNARKHLSRMQAWEWSDEALLARVASGEDISFGEEKMRAEYPDLSEITILQPDVFFTDELVFDLGNIDCRLVAIPSPHSDDAAAIFIPQEKVLFLGDATSPDYYNNEQYDLELFDALITWLEKCDFEICLLGHWTPLSKEELLNFLKQQRGSL